MKKLLLLLLICSYSHTCTSNAAQPGLWNTGNGSQFYPLFAEDSIYFGKIKMHKELVLINLYKGYAVVKGEYWMQNNTNQDISMTVGYPVNGALPNEIVDNVMFDRLYELKVLVNDEQMKIFSTFDSSYQNNRPLVQQTAFRNNDWYYWKTTFKAGSTTKITVYFITDNSRAKLRKGYSGEKGNAFSYILETGKAWAGNIDSGKIFIRFNDGLTLKNIKGVLPDKIFMGNDSKLAFSFVDLEPTPANNLLIWYDGISYDAFKIEDVLKNSVQLYKEINNFPIEDFNNTTFQRITLNNFSIADNTWTWFWVIGLIIIAAVIGLLGFIIYRLTVVIIKSRQKNNTA